MQYPCIIIIENFLDCNTARRALALHDQNAKRRLRIPKRRKRPSRLWRVFPGKPRACRGASPPMRPASPGARVSFSSPARGWQWRSAGRRHPRSPRRKTSPRRPRVPAARTARQSTPPCARRTAAGVAHLTDGCEAVDDLILQPRGISASVQTRIAQAAFPAPARRSEQAGEQPSRQPCHAKHDRRKRQAPAKDVPLRAHHAIDLSRAVIETEDGLRAAADASQRHRHYEHEALNDGGHSDQKIALPRAAIALEHGVHGDDHGVVHRNDRKGRKAERQHAANDGGFQAGPLDANLRAPAQQKAQRVAQLHA